MARLMDGEIEKLKQEVSLLDLVQSYGVELKKKGKDLIGLCPFHDDHSPSLVISPDKNLWHCMGACQEGGSVIDWVMKSEGVSLRHALEILKEKDHLTSGGLGGEVKAIKRTTLRKLDSPFDHSVENQELLNQVVDFYHDTLKQNPQGLDYLQQRRLKNLEMIDYFKLGLANRTLCYRLPMKGRQAGDEIRAKLLDLGILRESGSEHFRGSLVIPIFDEQGNVMEIYGRKINTHLRKGTAHHLYLPGPHRGVWNFSCLAENKEIILCEALIDALTFWCYGYRNVTASYGINGFTVDHLQAFKRCGIQRVFIAYDRDEAGDKAAETLGQKLISEGIDCFRVQFPIGLDANQYALQAHNVEKAFNHIIQNAVCMGNGNERKNKKIASVRLPVVLVASEFKGKEAAKEEKKTEKEKAPSAPLEPSAHPAPHSLPGAAGIGCDIANISAEVKPQEIIIPQENRRWRIRGLAEHHLRNHESQCPGLIEWQLSC